MTNNIISVIMGIKYTRPELDTLRRSIDSILAQTYSDLELLICERGSSRKAKECLSEYAARDGRIRIIDGSGAVSFSEQLNMCLAQARGEWIARMDDDDYSDPERFERQLEYLKAHTDIAFVGCNVTLIQDGEDAGVQCFPERPVPRDFLFSMPFIHPSLMFRKAALEQAGGYSTLTRCERCEDYDLLLRLYENGGCGANIQEFLFAYSLPHNGITTRGAKDRINEFKTRCVRFAKLNMLPGALPYAVKPLVVGLIPRKALKKLKERERRKAAK